MADAVPLTSKYMQPLLSPSAGGVAVARLLEVSPATREVTIERRRRSTHLHGVTVVDERDVLRLPFLRNPAEPPKGWLWVGGAGAAVVLAFVVMVALGRGENSFLLFENPRLLGFCFLSLGGIYVGVIRLYHRRRRTKGRKNVSVKGFVGLVVDDEHLHVHYPQEVFALSWPSIRAASVRGVSDEIGAGEQGQFQNQLVLELHGGDKPETLILHETFGGTDVAQSAAKAEALGVMFEVATWLQARIKATA